jgi:hypothetical protein
VVSGTYPKTVPDTQASTPLQTPFMSPWGLGCIAIFGVRHCSTWLTSRSAGGASALAGIGSPPPRARVWRWYNAVQLSPRQAACQTTTRGRQAEKCPFPYTHVRSRTPTDISANHPTKSGRQLSGGKHPIRSGPPVCAFPRAIPKFVSGLGRGGETEMKRMPAGAGHRAWRRGRSRSHGGVAGQAVQGSLRIAREQGFRGTLSAFF